MSSNRHQPERSRSAAAPRGPRAFVLLAALGLAAAGPLRAQGDPRPLPFGIGEELTYDVKTDRFGRIGRGSMRVEGPEAVRERETLVLRFDFRSKIGPFTIEDRTRSWIVPGTLATLRFHKRERQPLSTRTLEVELFPEERRWASGTGEEGRSPTDAPLDELSFIYFIRTLPLDDGAVYSVARHFDAERNPVTVRVLERRPLETPAGTMPAILVEMRVNDPRRFGGSGVIRLYLTDDDRRYPVRIETSMPVVGTTILELRSSSPAGAAVR